MINWDADLLAHTHQAFGEQATYYPAAGAARSVTVVFNDNYTTVKFESGMEVASTLPVLNIRESALPDLPELGDLWRIRGVLYQASAVQPDGVGDIRVFLRLASNDQARLAHLAPTQPP